MEVSVWLPGISAYSGLLWWGLGTRTTSGGACLGWYIWWLWYKTPSGGPWAVCGCEGWMWTGKGADNVVAPLQGDSRWYLYTETHTHYHADDDDDTKCTKTEQRERDLLSQHINIKWRQIKMSQRRRLKWSKFKRHSLQFRFCRFFHTPTSLTESSTKESSLFPHYRDDVVRLSLFINNLFMPLPPFIYKDLAGLFYKIWCKILEA